MPTRMPGRERDGETAGVLDRPQPHGRDLVGRTEVGTPALRQPVGRRLEHHAHRGAHVLQPRELLVAHHAGVQVREQARLLDHADRDGAQVAERRAVPALLQPLPRHVVPLLRPVAEREERFLAAHLPTRLGDRDDLVGGEERVVQLGGRLGERAVVTVVAAEHRERDEDLAGVGDGVAVAEIPEARGEGHEPLEVGSPRGQERLGLVERNRLPRPGASDGATQLLRGRLGHLGEPTTLCRDADRGARGRGRGGEVPPRGGPRVPR